MIDRPIHHADILSLKGDSYRLKGRDLGPPSTTRLVNTLAAPTLEWPSFQPAKPASFSTALTSRAPG